MNTYDFNTYLPAGKIINRQADMITDLRRENKRLREVGDRMAEHILTVSGGGEGVLDLWAEIKP